MKAECPLIRNLKPSLKLSFKQPWRKGFQICSNIGPYPIKVEIIRKYFQKARDLGTFRTILITIKLSTCMVQLN